MEPITRKEKYLAKLNGQDINIDPPITNEEYYLAYLCGEDYGLPTPVTLDEMYLAAMCGVIYVLPMPITRLQRIWKQLIETGESDITPGTREELYWVGVDLWDIVYSTVSGNPVMFTAIHPDLLKQLKVAFSPVQDLHGYDAPWPAGGGKNKLEVTATSDTINGVTFTVNSDGTITTSGTASANAFFTVGNATFINDSPSGTYILSGCPANGGNPYNMDVQGATGADSGTGRTVEFTGESINTNVRIRIYSGTNATGLVFKPMICLATVSNPDYAHFAPYSNECPISGWDGVEVWRTGKNLWNPSDCTKVGWNIEWPNPVKGFPVGTSVTFSTEPFSGGNGALLQYLDATDTWRTITTWQFGKTELVKTVTITEGMRTASKMHFTGQSNTFSAEEIEAAHFQIELSDERTEYQPYTGRSISISFGSTVYSGTLDVLTGVMTVTHIKKAITNVTPWGATAKGYAVYMAVSEATHIVTEDQKPSLVSNIFTWDSFNGYAKMEVFTYGGASGAPQTISFILPPTITSRAEANAWFAANPTECMFALATPITIQLTPQEVESLAGDNVLFSDANGDITVEYRSN